MVAFLGTMSDMMLLDTNRQTKQNKTKQNKTNQTKPKQNKKNKTK